MRLARHLIGCFLVAASVAQAGEATIPKAGETVTWSLSESPIMISGQSTIPVGGSVVVEPGVTIDFAPLSRLFVEGELSAIGTSLERITIAGQVSGWLVVRGHVELVECQIDNTIAQSSGGLLEISDSAFGVSSATVTDIVKAPTVALIDRTSIATPFFSLVGQVRLRDVAIASETFRLSGAMVLENVTSQGTPLEFWREYQKTFVDGVSVTGAPGPGLILNGGSDFLIDSSVVLSGNEYPVQTKGSGLVPGSVIPLSGNTNNAVLGFEGNTVHSNAVVTMPDIGLPYHFLEGPEFADVVDVHPGVTVKLGPAGRFALRGNMFRRSVDVRGEPSAPIVFERLNASQPWLSLNGIGVNSLFEHVVVDGAAVGVASAQSSIWLSEATIRNSDVGLRPSGLGQIHARGVQFRDNVTGAETDTSIVSSGGLDLDGTERPNIFEGNVLAFDKTNTTSTVTFAENNWWGATSGPFQASGNPTGQGDPVDTNIDFTPWLTSEPDLSNTPPVVRVDDPFFLVDPGETLIVQWTSSDDDGVVAHDILLDTSGGGPLAFAPVVSDLPGDMTSFAFVMPDPGFNVFARPALLRVVATDSLGQTSFDEITLHVSSADYSGTFAFDNDLSGVFEHLDQFPVCWSAFGTSGSLRAYLFLDGDERRKLGPAGNTGSACSFSNLIMPAVSTDTARIGVHSDGNGNDQEWFFSDEFTIRNSPLLGDEAPTVTMHSPTAGETYTAGSLMPVTWTAADDDGMRSFKVQVSLNAGRTWQTIVRDLPASSTSYAWSVPLGVDVADARVRVIAFDTRFQNSSDGTDGGITISGGGALWVDLGFAKPGSTGTPLLTGSGALTAGSTATLEIDDGPSGASSWLVVGFGAISQPFRGGVLVPSPDVVIGPFALTSQGMATLAGPWPSGIPSGFATWWQCWSVDGGVFGGFAASNAIKSTTN